MRYDVDITKDKEWGENKENEVIKVFYEWINRQPGNKDRWLPFQKLGIYDHFDFIAKPVTGIGGDCYVEVKSRNNALHTYESTMFGSVKTCKALRLIGLRNKVWMVFNFTDCIACKNLSSSTVSFDFIARTDRGATELNHYTFLPVKQLRIIKEY